MAQPETYVSTSPRDNVALDGSVTQMADRILLAIASVQAIMNAYSGITAADLQAAPYNKSSTVATGLINGMTYLNTWANDATVAAFLGHIRNIGR